MRVTALISRHESPGVPADQQPRSLEAVDEFVAQLSAMCNIEIPILEGTLDIVPQGGVILVFDSASLRAHPDVAKRAVLINADRAFVLKNLEEYSLVAAVEKQRYFRWRTNPSAETGEGVFGQKRLAEKIQATATPGPFTTERYVLLRTDQSSNLVALLARYLVAYAASDGDQEPSTLRK